MLIKILEKKKIQHRTWYLCKGKLIDYLNGLKINFYEYAIQRRIVKNQYLDKLYSTIQVGDPIPTITLTCVHSKLHELENNEANIDLKQTEILDGLQRSFRLWAYLVASNLYSKSKTDYRSFAKELKEENPLFFDSGVISTRVIKNLIETNEIENIPKLFENYEVYFTIWTGLTEKEVIQKMLLLNAGQKSVSKTHQFELLFLHFFETINSSDSKVQLYREKDPKANEIKRGVREIGEFMFSSTIVALQSLIEGKPLRVSTEKLIENEFQDNEDTPENVYDIVFNSKYIYQFLDKLFELDQVISAKEKTGKEWFSKDTSISGVFAAIGNNLRLTSLKSEAEIIEKTDEVFQKLIKSINENGLHLNKFTDEYNELSSRSVNIGSFIRKVVMEYFLSLLEGNSPTWNDMFNKLKN